MLSANLDGLFYILEHLFEMSRQLKFNILVDDRDLIQILKNHFRWSLPVDDSGLDTLGITEDIREDCQQVDIKNLKAVDCERGPKVEAADTALV